MPRGGHRPGAGRKPNKGIVEGGAELCQRVLDRIPELQRVVGKEKIKCVEDYILFVLLGAQDVRVNKEALLALLYMIYGKPTQTHEVSGKGRGAVNVVLSTNLELPPK